MRNKALRHPKITVNFPLSTPPTPEDTLKSNRTVISASSVQSPTKSRLTMTNKPIGRRELSIGMTVEINPQNDKTRKNLIHGNVEKILTSAESHPHGILVLLESGVKGRVKSIINEDTNESEPKSQFDSPSVRELLQTGENGMVEFKTYALWSTKYTGEDIKNHRPQSAELHKYGQATSKYIIAKTLGGFLNTDGGTLVIGAFEHKDGTIELIGIDGEYEKLKDKTSDGYRRMLIELIDEYFSSDIFNRFSKYFQISFDEIDNKTLCAIDVKKSDMQAFVSIKKEEFFFIRVDASTRSISASQLIEYCDKRFSK